MSPWVLSYCLVYAPFCNCKIVYRSNLKVQTMLSSSREDFTCAFARPLRVLSMWDHLILALETGRLWKKKLDCAFSEFLWTSSSTLNQGCRTGGSQPEVSLSWRRSRGRRVRRNRRKREKRGGEEDGQGEEKREGRQEGKKEWERKTCMKEISIFEGRSRIIN